MFPPMVIQMILWVNQRVLRLMLSKIADFYEEEVDVAVANLTSS
jgi:type IV pilus assembly protein PilC